MSLAERLKQYRLARMSERSRAAHADIVEKLFRAEVASCALKAGDTAPDFLLPNAEGLLVSQADLLAQGPLVATFFRGGWCPYCDIAMRAMEAALPDIHAAGGTFAAIWPKTGGQAFRTKRERALTYELLVDVDHALAMQFGITFRVSDLYGAVLADSGIDLAARHGNPAWLLPIPATFVIGPDRVIRYAFVDGDFTRRAEPAKTVDVLRGLAV